MVALTNSIETRELLMEHLYPADRKVPLIKQTLTTGLTQTRSRPDLSAVIHVERFAMGGSC